MSSTEFLKSGLLRYPEHEKLKEVEVRSQAVGDFVTWMEDRGFSFQDANGSPPRGCLIDWLAEFFEIDQKVLEKEKRAMIAAIRKYPGRRSLRP